MDSDAIKLVGKDLYDMLGALRDHRGQVMMYSFVFNIFYVKYSCSPIFNAFTTPFIKHIFLLLLISHEIIISIVLFKDEMLQTILDLLSLLHITF